MMRNISGAMTMNTALSMSSMTNSPVWVLAQGQVIALGTRSRAPGLAAFALTAMLVGNGSIRFSDRPAESLGIDELRWACLGL